MAADSNIDFRFVTRTLRDDYHVYADSGRAVFSDQTEFDPLRRKCGINPEDGGCAAMFEDGGKIFLVVSGLSSGRKDISGRPIRFSFCGIFRDRTESYAAFSRIITQWENTEAEIQSLFHEEKNGVFFEQEKFIDWLQAGRTANPDFEVCRHGDVRGIHDIIWPSHDCIVKWLHSEADEVFCL